MMDIERRFGEAMFAIYREAEDIGYLRVSFFACCTKRVLSRQRDSLSMLHSLQTATRDYGSWNGWI